MRSSWNLKDALRYRHKNKTVHLLTTPEMESGRVLLAGEVICAGTNNGLVVLLTDGMKTEARTTTHRVGEFQLEFEIMEDPGLEIRLDQGYWVACALSKPDWAKKRPVEPE